MRPSKVKTFYGKLDDNELSTLAGKVVGAMEANAYFPEPTIALADFEAQVEDHREKTEKAANGGSTFDKRLRDESRLLLIKSLRTLAHYVNVQADGNLPALTSSGMLLEKQPSENGTPFLVENLQTKDGNISGQIRADFTPQKKVDGYELQLGLQDPASKELVWNDPVYTPKSKGNILAPVIPGQRYYVRVRARNNKGLGDWSEPVSIIAR